MPRLVCSFVLTLLSLTSSFAAARAGECPWAGIYPTVVTPWCCTGGVDEPALAAQIDYQLKNGVQGLLVLGTIGEGEYATLEERSQVIRVAVGQAKGCVPVVVGIHTCNCEAARVQMRQARELGAQAVLVKYAGRPGACYAEVFGFFQDLAATGCLPIFYYHYPSQTGLKLAPGEVSQILLIPGVIGIKESILDLKEVEAHIAMTRGHGRIFLSGTTLNLTQFMARGGHGAMGPEVVLMPGKAVACYRAMCAGDADTARCLQKELFAVASVLRGGITSKHMAQAAVMTTQDHHIKLPMGSSHPQARLKYALNFLCVPTSPQVKCPLPPLSAHDRWKVERAMWNVPLECKTVVERPAPVVNPAERTGPASP
jgi:4-hydroxy-tetrahydrodipicolinate synthase